MKRYNICICSGGNISHALAGVLSYNGRNINVLTRQPDRWDTKLTTYVNTPNTNTILKSNLNIVSSDPSVVLQDVDIVIIASPIMAFNDILVKIKDYLKPNMVLMCIPGRLFMNYIRQHNITNDVITLIRTPYICTVKDYGRSVNISGTVYGKINYWCKSGRSDIVTDLFDFDNNQLTNHLSVDLVNSNLLLHSCRLYVLFSMGKCYDEKPGFYKDWCIDSSELLIDCDVELNALISKINEGNDNKVYVKSILEHYESHDKVSLANKIRSLGSLPERSPVVLKGNKYYGDITHRYFQEEIVAIKFVLGLAETYGVAMENMKKIYECFISLQNT